jgi:hypothetical protein
MCCCMQPWPWFPTRCIQSHPSPHPAALSLTCTTHYPPPTFPSSSLVPSFSWNLVAPLSLSHDCCCSSTPWQERVCYPDASLYPPDKSPSSSIYLASMWSQWSPRAAHHAGHPTTSSWWPWATGLARRWVPCLGDARQHSPLPSPRKPRKHTAPLKIPSNTLLSRHCTAFPPPSAPLTRASRQSVAPWLRWASPPPISANPPLPPALLSRHRPGAPCTGVGL